MHSYETAISAGPAGPAIARPATGPLQDPIRVLHETCLSALQVKGANDNLADGAPSTNIQINLTPTDCDPICMPIRCLI